MVVTFRAAAAKQQAGVRRLAVILHTQISSLHDWACGSSLRCDLIAVGQRGAGEAAGGRGGQAACGGRAGGGGGGGGEGD